MTLVVIAVAVGILFLVAAGFDSYTNLQRAKIRIIELEWVLAQVPLQCLASFRSELHPRHPHS